MSKKGPVDREDLYKEVAREIRSKVRVVRCSDIDYMSGNLLSKIIEIIKDRQKELLQYKGFIDITAEEVRNAVRFQFAEVKRVMAAGNYQTIRLAYFGAFKVKDKRLEKLNKDK